MTLIGRSVLIVYSLLVVIIIMAVSVCKLEKGSGNGWETAILIPVFILLANLI
jgi:hypothetical protein